MRLSPEPVCPALEITAVFCGNSATVGIESATRQVPPRRPRSVAVFMKNAFSIPLIVLSILCFFGPSPCESQATARTVSRTIDQLIAESDRIVHGFVLSTKIEPHPTLHNLMTEVVTMQVADTYKGQSPKTLTFRQYVWNIERGKTVSDYPKGQELVLLLRPVSEYGLTSPAGLEQGRFRITLDASHRSVAINGRGNVGLFEHIEENARAARVSLSPHLTTVVRQRPVALPLADLEQIIRTFARSR